MKKSKTIDRVDVYDAINHIIESKKKMQLDNTKDIVGRVFGEVVKQMGLCNTKSMHSPYGECIDSEVKKISKIASEIDGISGVNADQTLIGRLTDILGEDNVRLTFQPIHRRKQFWN